MVLSTFLCYMKMIIFMFLKEFDQFDQFDMFLCEKKIRQMTRVSAKT